MYNQRYNNFSYPNVLRYPQTKNGVYKMLCPLPKPALTIYKQVPSFSNLMLTGVINMNFNGELYQTTNRNVK